MKFAKLFDLDNDDQILVTKDLDEETDQPTLVVSIDVDFVRPEVILNYKDEEARDKAFEAYNEKDAEAFRKSILEQDFMIELRQLVK